MKVYVNRLPMRSAWGGGAKFINAVYDMLEKHDMEVIEATNNNVAPDIALCVGIENDFNGISTEQAIMYRMVMEGKRKVKVIARINENDARKGTTGVDEKLLEISNHVDGTIFVSDWLQDYFMTKGWGCKENIVIKNGVDLDIFKPAEKLNNGKVNIVAHHWSDNYMKGFDIYEKIDEWVGSHPDYSFTYIGRDRNTFKNTKVIKPLGGKRLGTELGKYDVYVSASRFDPGPNHILEALACGLPTLVHKDGGGCVEFASPGAVYNDWDELKHILECKNYGNFVKQFSAPVDGWERCVEQCANFFKKIYGE